MCEDAVIKLASVEHDALITFIEIDFLGASFVLSLDS